MIQRIQSLYLLICAVLCIVLVSTDIVYYTESGKVSKDLNTTTISVDYNSTETSTEHIGRNDGLVYFLIATALVALVAIFMFKNRKLQSKMALAVTVLSVAVMILMYQYSYGMDYPMDDSEKQLLMGAFYPISVLIFSLLAFRAISRDEKLVKSLDRIR